MAIAELPPAVPYGTLQEYIENQSTGDWIPVPAGTTGQNVLIVPSQLYEPRGNQDEYHVYSGNCGAPADCCSLIFHEANIGAVFNGATSCRPQGDCATQLTSQDPDIAATYAFFQAQNGAPLSSIYPAWFLDELRAAGMLPPEREALGLIFDWATIWCMPDTEVLPNIPILPVPIGATCALPDVNYVNGGCPTGFFADPALPGCCKPLDPPVPRGMKNLAGPMRELFPTPGEFGYRSRTRARGFSVPAPGPRTPAPLQLGPALPTAAVMPMPAGNCGCGVDSEELDAL